MTELARQHVRKILEGRLLDETNRVTQIRDLEAAGHRIIDGGQTERLTDGSSGWEILDWRTREVIARGVGEDEYEATCKSLDPHDKWLHIDNVDNSFTDPVTEGVPESLAVALDEWVGSSGTPDEDIAEWVGWSVEKVRRYRSES